jgi:N-methylhydantoinase A/oxoprolinase/acetone carboxylase beta subunit
MVWTVGVDVGGTFTDFFAVDESNGSVHVGKFPYRSFVLRRTW